MNVPDSLRPELERIASGALAYTRNCTALSAAPREVCIVTDHRILQLSWTRDAYYQALLLLRAGDEVANLDLVADHLRWLWGGCRRTHALWARSHLPNGEPKDLVFQADQQLYPLLELVDHRDASGTWPDPPGSATWAQLVDELWTALPAHDGLLPSDENPADDSSEFPYSLSTQILYWHTARRLSAVSGELRMSIDFAHAADTIRRAVEHHFTVDGPFGPQWAYEVDGLGRMRLYHDANDVPTALAPLWGFCDAAEPRWAATMRFAFSAHNPGYCDGPFGGLGSLHTAGTWPLGDIQEWVAMSLLDNEQDSERALARLVAVAADDGMLPEAYDPDTGDWVARHWFAWPGALLGALLQPAQPSGFR